MPGGAQLWQYRDKYFLAGRAKSGDRYLLAGRGVPDDFPDRIKQIETQTQAYLQQYQQLRTYKDQLYLTLLLFTASLRLMFSDIWFALFLSKQVTIPIQALAEATQEIAAGHFEARVNVQAQDELETLVRSFNRMTEQLSDSRRQIDEFTHSLQQAVQELERRRTLIETILENIPTGVHFDRRPGSDCARESRGGQNAWREREAGGIACAVSGRTGGLRDPHAHAAFPAHGHFLARA